MIELLHINEYIYLKNLDIYFSSGLNVITGETGTGKSLLLDIIGTFLDYGNVRSDIFSADIVINLPYNYEEFEIEQGQHIFSVEKKSKRAFYKIDGKLIPKDVVVRIFSDVITIHKQNSHMKLLERDFIINFLDDIAGNNQLLKIYKETYAKYQNLIKQLSSLDRDEILSKIEELSEKIKEVESAKLDIFEEEQLEENYKKALNIQALLQNYNAALNQIEDITFSLRKTYSLVEEQYYEYLDRAIEQLSELQNNINKELLKLDEVNVDEIENRLWVYKRLRRKYGPTTEDVLENLKGWKEELKKLEELIVIMKNADLEMKKLEREVRDMAKEISQARKKAAKNIINEVKKHLEELNMKTRIDFLFVEKDISIDGIDEIELVGSTLNKGEMYPLRKIASGGELSRIMLAVELSTVSTPTLIYDEVDSGVGGLTAVKLADKLEKLSKKHQIIIVTHLPQIALKADKHFSIVRNNDIGTVIELDNNARTEELKRMLGGEDIIELFKEER